VSQRHNKQIIVNLQGIFVTKYKDRSKANIQTRQKT